MFDSEYVSRRCDVAPLTDMWAKADLHFDTAIKSNVLTTMVMPGRLDPDHPEGVQRT